MKRYGIALGGDINKERLLCLPTPLTPVIAKVYIDDDPKSVRRLRQFEVAPEMEEALREISRVFSVATIDRAERILRYIDTGKEE